MQCHEDYQTHPVLFLPFPQHSTLLYFYPSSVICDHMRPPPRDSLQNQMLCHEEHVTYQAPLFLAPLPHSTLLYLYPSSVIRDNPPCPQPTDSLQNQMLCCKKDKIHPP